MGNLLEDMKKYMAEKANNFTLPAIQVKKDKNGNTVNSDGLTYDEYVAYDQYKKENGKSTQSTNKGYENSGKTRDDYDAAVRSGNKKKAESESSTAYLPLPGTEKKKETVKLPTVPTDRSSLEGGTIEIEKTERKPFYSLPTFDYTEEEKKTSEAVSAMEKKLKQNTTLANAADKMVKSSLKAYEDAQNRLDNCANEIRTLEAQYSQTPDKEIAKKHDALVDEYDKILSEIKDISASYDSYVTDYKDILKLSDTDVAEYNAQKNKLASYAERANAEYEKWKATVRGSEVVKPEAEALDKAVTEIYEKMKYAEQRKQLLYAGVRRQGDYERVKGEIADLDASIASYQKELDALKGKRDLTYEELSAAEDIERAEYYASYTDRADFADNSKYVSTKNGEAILTWAGYYTSPYGDMDYEIINGNDEAKQQRENNYLKAGTTDAKKYLYHFTDTEKNIYNYIYKTEGKGAADSFVELLKPTLTERERKSTEEKWTELSKEDPVGTSVVSVILNLSKPAVLVGQLADFITSGSIDENASYNAASHISGAIRGTVAENLGGFGGFLYQTGMSIADFATVAALTGGSGASLAIMGMSSAADTTIEAKDRGLSDGQAIILGAASGLIEAATEKIGLDNLMNVIAGGGKGLKGALKDILKQTLSEGGEEILSAVGNDIVDVLVSLDKSKWETEIDALMETDPSLSRNEAWGKVFGSHMLEYGLSGISGALSGGVMGGAGVGINALTGGFKKLDTSKVEKHEIKTPEEAKTEKNDTKYPEPYEIILDAEKAPIYSDYYKYAESVAKSGELTAENILRLEELWEKRQHTPEAITEVEKLAGEGKTLDEVEKSVRENYDVETITYAEIEDAYNEASENVSLQGIEHESQNYENKAENIASTEVIPTAENAVDNDTAAVEKIKNAIPELSEMDAVSNLTGNEFPKSSKKLTEQVGEFFASLKNKITRKGFGDVIIDVDGVQSSIAHGLGRAKAVTFAAVPDVIANGKQIDHQTNLKNRGYDTYIFAAPVKIGNKNGYVGVVVSKHKESNRYYLHEVIDSDGNIFKISKDADLFKTESSADKSASPGKSTSSDNSISQNTDLDNTFSDNNNENATNEGVSSYESEHNESKFQEKEARDDIPDGSGKRNARESSRESSGELGQSTKGWKDILEGADSADEIGRARTAATLRTEHISSASLGIANGTDTPRLRIYPEEKWDDNLKNIQSVLKKETGKEVIFVQGPIEIRTKTGVRNVRGVNMDEKIIIRMNDLKVHPENIAFHELYHERVAESSGLNEAIKEAIIERFSEEEFNEVLEGYADKLAGIYEFDEHSEEEYNAVLDAILEEIFADAYANINGFGVHPEKFRKTVVKITEAEHKRVQSIKRKAANVTKKKDQYSVDDPGYFTYQSLISKPDMIIPTFTVPNSYGTAQLPPRNVVIKEALSNARLKNNPKNTKENVFLRNKDTGTDILINQDSIKHGLYRKYEKNAIASANIGDIIENAILINEHSARAGNNEGSIYLGAGWYGNDLFLCRIITDENNVMGDFEVMYALNTKKESVAHNRLGIANKSLSNTNSTISIADFLDIVKTHYADVLPNDVLRQMSMMRPNSPISNYVKYSVDDSAVSAYDSKQDLIRDCYDIFSVPEGNRKELRSLINSLAEGYIKKGSFTEEDRNKLLDRLYAEGVMTVPAEDYYKSGRAVIAKGKIYISGEVKALFGDEYNAIRKRAFSAGVFLTNNKNDAEIASWNAKLSKLFPDSFSSGETDERTIIESIISMAEDGKDQKMSLAEYAAMSDEEGYIPSTELFRQMEKKLDIALRTFAEKARLEIKLRQKDVIREAKRRQARLEAAQQKKEMQNVKEVQNETIKTLQWLMRHQNKASDEFKAKFKEVLSDIDIFAKSAADAMRWSDKYQATWQDIEQMYKDAQENDPNFLPSKEIEKIIARLNNRKVADMDMSALMDLYKAAIALKTEYQNRQYLILDQKHRTHAEIYKGISQEMANGGEKHDPDALEKFFNNDQLTPMNVLERMGGWNPEGALYGLGKMLEQGEYDVHSYIIRAGKILDDFLERNKDWVRKADGQHKNSIWYTEEIHPYLGKGKYAPETVTVHMTPAMRVYLYLESKGYDNVRHMTAKGGGRTFADKELYSKGKRAEAFAQGTTVRLSPETIKQLADPEKMTEQELELAKLMEDYYKFAKTEMNKTSNALHGFSRAMGNYYAQIFTNKNYTKVGFDHFSSPSAEGSIKERMADAENPTYCVGAFDAFERHVNATSKYVGLSIPVHNFKVALNWREERSSASDLITHKWGKEGLDYIHKMLEDIQSTDMSDKSTVEAFVSKLSSNYISAVFGLNPSIVFKQVGSMMTAATYLGWNNRFIPQKGRADYKKMGVKKRQVISQYTNELDYRTLGYSSEETKTLKDNPNWLDRNPVTAFLIRGDAITWMDGAVAKSLWRWTENEVRRENPELELGTNEEIMSGESEFYKAVAERYNYVVSRTQSMSDFMHQSTMRKSKNLLARMLTLFKSDAAQNYNIHRQLIGEALYLEKSGASKKEVGKAWNRVGRAVLNTLLGYSWAALINLLINLWKYKGKRYKDDEGELTAESAAWGIFEDVLSNYAGIVVLGEELTAIIPSVIKREFRYDTDAIEIEQLNELFSILENKSKLFIDICAGAINVLNGGGDVGKYFSKKSSEIIGGIRDIAKTCATYIWGLPADNLEKYLLGAVKWVSPELGAAYDDITDTVQKKDLKELSGKALEGRIGRLMEQRGVNIVGETTSVLAKLYNLGYSDVVPSATPTKKTIDGEEIVFDQYTQQTYDNEWSKIVGDVIDQVVSSKEFKGSEDEIKKQFISKLYSYAEYKALLSIFPDMEVPEWIKEADVVIEDEGLEEWVINTGLTSNFKELAKDAYYTLCDNGFTKLESVKFAKEYYENAKIISSAYQGNENESNTILKVAKVEALSNLNIPEKVKIDFYKGNLASESELKTIDDRLATFKKQGLGFGDYLAAYSADILDSEKELSAFLGLNKLGYNTSDAIELIEKYNSNGKQLSKIYRDEIGRTGNGIYKVDSITTIKNLSCSETAKKTLYQNLLIGNDSADVEKFQNKLDALKNVGIGFETFLKIDEAYSKINRDEDKYTSVQEMSIAFSRWLNAQKFTSKQQEVIKDNFKYWISTAVSAGSFDKYVSAGVSENTALLVTRSLKGMDKNEEIYPTLAVLKISEKEKIMIFKELCGDNEAETLDLTLAQCKAKGVGFDDYLHIRAAGLSKNSLNAVVELMGAGIKRDVAISQIDSISKLEPNRGRKSLNEYQKAYAAINNVSDANAQLKVTDSFLGDNTYKKIELAYKEFYITPKQYLEVRDAVEEFAYKTTGKTNITNKIAEEVLKEMNIGTGRKAILWTFLTDGAAKNNPFDKEQGQWAEDAIKSLKK